MGDTDHTLHDVDGDGPILAGVIANMVTYALMRGIPMEVITAATGLREADLADLDAYLPGRLGPMLFELLADHFPGHSVGLELAQMAPPLLMGPMALAKEHVDSIRALVALFNQYVPLVTRQCLLRVEPGGAHTAIAVLLKMPARAYPHGIEAALGLLHAAVDGLISSDWLVRLEFEHAPIAARSFYEAHFGVRCRFEQPRSRLVMHTASMDAPLAAARPRALAYIRAHLDSLKEAINTTDTGPLAEVHAAIDANARQGEYGGEALAKKMGMSLRNLQRLLASHGTSTRAELERARQSNAEALLADRRLSIDTVAMEVGYSATNAFTRAFKRWTGLTPAQYRRQLR